jgi:aryl-alcohol dehydrogenase-like predicted oxidoreductase
LRNLKVARDHVVVATKVFGETGPGSNMRGNTRSHILDGIKASLKRLQLEHIDLYQIHGFDPATPIEETVRALDQLVRHGHVRYVGVSNWAAWQIVKALGIAERLGLARFESLQAYYTIAGRDLEREIVPMLRSEGLGLMVWSPLAGGLLSGKYGREQQGEQGSRRTTFDFPPVNKERAWDIVDVMRDIAQAREVSVAQVALAWLLHQPQVTSVIVGAKRPEQLADNIRATELRLDASELEKLNAASALPPEYPGWMFERQGEARRKQLREAGR